ncbi:hypothetical protein N8489_01035, partial [Akkermansiaceae bacterium]|nr:hypothetical protein [Akkermansiaceae bacterium]
PCHVFRTLFMGLWDFVTHIDRASVARPMMPSSSRVTMNSYVIFLWVQVGTFDTSWQALIAHGEEKITGLFRRQHR